MSAPQIKAGDTITHRGNDIRIRSIWINRFDQRKWVSYSQTDGKAHGCCRMDELQATQRTPATRG